MSGKSKHGHFFFSKVWKRPVQLREMMIDDVMITDVCNTRKELLQNLDSANNLFYLSEERAKIKHGFDHAFQQKMSTSLIIIGSSGNECVNLVKSVLDSYKSESFLTTSLGNRYSKSKNYTARVNGSLHAGDQEALADLANQFLVRSDREGGSSLALEDLEDHFRQCRLDGIPAVVVIEDFHVFTKRKRQTLIYALLDLMHKKDLLFTIVGITDHSDIETKLEKRVISRLNAQYIFMSKATGADVCEYLRNVCTLRPSSVESDDASSAGAGAGAGADHGSQKKSGRGGSSASCKVEDSTAVETLISVEYARHFCAQVDTLFGKYAPTAATAVPAPAATAAPTDATGATTGADENESKSESKSESESESEGVRPRFFPGVMHTVFSMHCDWGRDLSYFARVALKAVCALSVEQPYLTSAIAHGALASLEPENIDEVLVSLSSLELHLFISVLNVYGRSQQGGAGSSAGSALSTTVGISSSSRPLVMLVDKVLAVCDMLVEVLKQKLVPKSRIVQALCSLAQKGLVFMMNVAPGRLTMPVSALSLGIPGAELAGSSSFGSITGQTLLMLNVSYEQAVDAFRVKRARDKNSAGGDVGYSGRPRVTIQISERLRKAVLEPIVPVVYLASASSSSSDRGVANSLTL